MANKTEKSYPIYTNNLNVEILRKNVDNQFTIYQIATNDKFYKTNVLDFASEKFKAQSVAYYQGNRWFAMFNKGSVNEIILKEEIHAKDDSAIINEVDLFNKDFDSNESIKDVELAQLLVNSLKNRSDNLFSYNNITGNLYYSLDVKVNAKTIELLKLRFYTHANNQIALEASTETFSEVESLKKYGKSKAEPKYVFDEETGEFRKKLHNDKTNGQKFFDKGALTRKGAKKKFLDFSTEENFKKSKTGIIANFLSDVEENLADYISISQVPLLDYKNCEIQRCEYENKDYRKFIKENGICIVDTVNTTESIQMKNSITDFLKEEYGISEIFDRRIEEKYIIEIIHDKESDFYAQKKDLDNPNLFSEYNKPKDQHNLFSEEEIIQHITVEKSSVKMNSDTIKDVMRNIVQELIIKENIKSKQISLVNWNEPNDWTFVKCSKGKWNKQKNSYNFRYYKITISQNGKLSFEIFDDIKYPEQNKEHAILRNIFEYYNKDNRKQYSNIECVVYKTIDDLNVIYKTKEYTLPDVADLAKTIALSDGKTVIAKSVLEQQLDEFISLHSFTKKQQDEINLLKQNIKDEEKTDISYKKLLTAFDEKGKKRSLIKIKLVKDFVDWLYNKTYEEENPILLHAQIKSKENLYKNFNSFLGIKSLILDGQFKYFVGKKESALQRNLPTSCVIRDVISWTKNGINKNGPIFFNEISHMLSVEFVRNGQYTVIPFPMKYLNEYIRLCEKDDVYDEDL